MRKTILKVWAAALACCGFAFNAHAATYTVNSADSWPSSLSNGDVINLSADFSQGGSSITVNKRVTIQSSDSTRRTFTRRAGCDFKVTSQVTLKNVQFKGPTYASNQSGIWLSGTGASLILENGAVIDGYVGKGGSSAAVFVGNGTTLTLNGGSTISNCKQNDASNGGALYVDGGTVKIAGGTISGCSTTGLGGAIYNKAGTVTMTSGTIDGCSSNGGGAINQQDDGTTTISGGTVKNCTAGTGNSGGVARIVGGTFTVTGGTFTGNKSTSGSGGGAFFLNSGTLNISGGSITGNTVTGANATGGAIYCYKNMTALNLSGSPKITGNTNAKGAEDNIAVNDQTAKVIQSGNLASGAKIGVHFPTSGTVAGTQFATRASTSYTGADTAFAYDLDASYEARANGTALVWYKPNYVCQIGTKKYEDFAAAFAAVRDGETIVFLADYTLARDLELAKRVTLDGNGHTLTRTAAAAEITVSANVTLRNLTVDGANLAAQDALFVVAPTGALTVQDGTTIKNCRNAAGNGGAIRANGPVNLQGGTIANCSAKEGGAVYPAAASTTVTTNAYTYYKVVFKKSGGGDFQLSELKLFDAQGNRINGGAYAAAAQNADPATLAVNQCTFASAENSWNNEGVANLFDDDTGTKMAGPFKLTDASDASKNLTVAFRVADNAAPAAGYMFTTGNDTASFKDRNPTDWVLYGSADGKNWTVLDTKTSFAGRTANYTELADAAWPVTGYATTTTTVPAAVVTVSGAAKAADNKATDGALSNVQLQSADQLALGGDFTGSVGVSYPAADPDGAVFGAAGSYAGADKFFYDGDATLTGVKEGATLAWPVRAVAQIGSTKYQTLAEAVAAAKDGDTIELLANVKLDADIAVDKNVTLTSAAGRTYAIARTADAQLAVTAGALTLTNVTLDGAQLVATKPLVDVAAGATLNLTTGATVARATAGGIAAAGTVNVAGNPVVAGNTAGGKASDLAPASANVLSLVGDFTGSIGVQWPLNVSGKELSGRPFGTVSEFAGAEKFFFDGKTKIAGTLSEEGRLVWPEITEEEVPMGDDTVVFDGATSVTALPDGDLVLVFGDRSRANTFTLPKNAKARILLVGGGGAGGSIGVGVEGAAGGGGAGGFIDRETTLAPGEYTVELGRGGLRVQTVAQSWVGDEGQNSCLRLGGEAVATAKGGGGGGTVKFGGAGTQGGAGGGGAWYGGSFLAGGLGTEGQGRAGATPDSRDFGGGGGGAQSAGGVRGAVGAGRTSDITGVEVLYAQGGRGGDRTDAAYAPQAGMGPGFGGDGAVNGFGGAGADGLVVVRIHKLFDYTLVPYPEFTSAFQWKAGETFVAFDYEKLSDLQKAAIANLDELDTGKYRTRTTCGQDATAADSGIGLYAFNLVLNDEYHWDDGTPAGSDVSRLCYWRVTDPDTEGHASVDVQKTVSFADGKNATISILAHSTPEMRRYVPKVLVVGTACKAHGFDQNVLNAALTAAAENANVHYEFYNTVSSKTDVSPVLKGDLSVGGTFNRTVTMEDGQHGGLYGFYETIAQVVAAKAQYDYVIFAFDRSLVGTYFPGTHPKEAEVSAWLKPLYDRNAVIWLVDNSEDADKAPVVEQFPWFPSQYLYVHWSGNTADYWSSLYQWEMSWGKIAQNDDAGAKAASFQALRAMFGLFDPSTYAVAAQNWAGAETLYNNNVVSGQNPTDAARIRATAGHAIEHQVVYDNAKNVAEMIKRVVLPVPAVLTLTDAVNVEEMGLKILEARASWTLDRAGAWTALEAQETETPDTATGLFYTYSESAGKTMRTGVQIRIPDVQNEAWIKLDIDVEDEGRFLSSINASFNEKTGQWMKDPNRGPVTMVMTQDGHDIVAEDEAKTAVEWNFTAFRLTGEVLHGEGEFVINGFVVNDDSDIDFRKDGISVREGSTPEVVFRGKPGWILDSLVVDGVAEPFTMETFNRYFENIGTDHDVKVGFRNVFEKPYPGTEPYEHVYDGTAYGCLLTSDPNFTDGLTFNWWPVYSLDPDGEFTKDGGQIAVKRDADGNVVPQTVYVRICIEQPGYEEPVILEDWTGSNLVTIQPRPIEISIDNQYQTSSSRIPTSSFTYEQLNGQLLEGDGIEVDYSCSYVQTQGGNTPITATVKIVHTDADGTKTDVTSNYAVTVDPGTYYYPKADQVMANAPDVVKYYDGQATNIDVTVSNPTKAPTQSEIKSMKGSSDQYNYIRNGKETKTILYSLTGDDDSWSETEPTFTDAGEYTVYYKVTYRYDFEHSRYSGNYSRYPANWTADSIEYEAFEGSAKVVVKPREVVVTAGSAEKIYDGTALTEAGYTVTPRDDLNGKGFAAGEGFQVLNMTAGSTITEPGTVANAVDAGSVKLNGNPANYNITYVDGSLTVTQNPLKATASGSEKTYDGKPIEWSGVAVTDKDGQPLASGYTVSYRTDPSAPWTTTPPELWTDAGEYPVFWKVDGGAGRGVVEGVSVLKINTRTVALVAGSAEQNYTGEPLTCTDFTVKPGTGADDGFVAGEGLAAVVMTKDSTITDPGKVANKIDLAAVDQWTFTGGAQARNYTFVVEDGTLKVNWVKEIKVTGPGTLTWKEQITAPADAKDDEVFLTITVDGGDPIRVSKGNMDDPKLQTLVFGGETDIEHVVSFVYTNDYGPQATCTVSDETWVPYDTDIAPALKDDPSAAGFEIANLGTDPAQFNKGTTLFDGGKLVTTGTVDADGKQTGDTVNTAASDATKGTEDYWYVAKDPRGGDNTVARTAPTLEPGEVVTLTIAVRGDGEFSWDSLVRTDAGEDNHPAGVTVRVDGVVQQVYGAEDDWTRHVIHVTDEPGKDGAEHLVEIVYTQDDDDAASIGYLDNLTWKPSATKPQMQQIVRTDPPTDADETQAQIRIDNSPESGWMPVKDPETGKVVAVRSPDGTEGTDADDDLDSTFTVKVTGTGEIKVDRITTPVKPSSDPSKPNGNTDNGQLTITVDGHTFRIPPESDETISYTVRTEGDTIVIENLVIKVTGEPEQEHVVTFEYTRDADDKSGNTAAVITGIEWKTYGENGKGGSSWLQGKALWIIDHEDPGDGYVYLAFEPELKVEEELKSWVERSAKNKMIRVKYGRTRAEADSCTPVVAALSDETDVPSHKITARKVWIKVSLKDLRQVTVVEPVGYWRIFIDGPAIRLSGTHDSGTGSLQGATPNAGLQDAAPIIGEGAVSPNMFGILKIESATTNTLIAVPWTWYSKEEGDAADIPVAKLVKTTNIGDDDVLLAWRGNGSYAAWTVDRDLDEWVPLDTVRVEAAASSLEITDPKSATGKMTIVSDDPKKPITQQISIPRGNGLWLCRKDPLNKDGTPKPFWIYGQSVTTDVETVIPAPAAGETVVSTMLGNPYAQEVLINDLVFEGEIDANDHIWVPNGTTTPYFLFRKSTTAGMKWCYSYFDAATRKTKYVTKIPVTPGLGFWYDRRGKTPLKIKWTRTAVAE